MKLKKTKTSEIEQLEYGKYGFEMLEFEKGNPNSRAKLRYGSGFIKVDNKTKKAELAYEACMGPEGDPLAVSQFDAALAAFQPDRQLYESTFPPAQILTCMSAYPGKILRDYEASYYGAQITAYSRERIRIGWARSRSMQLNHQKFAFSHFILTRGGRTIVGVDAGTKEGFVGALKTTIGEKSWMGTLAKSCAVHGDDREAIYWPRSDR